LKNGAKTAIGDVKPLPVRVKTNFRRILNFSALSGGVGEVGRIERDRLDLDEVAGVFVDAVDDQLRVELRQLYPMLKKNLRP
jgi:hypothetical protein